MDDASDAGPVDNAGSVILVPHHPRGARIGRHRLAAELAVLGDSLGPGPVADVLAIGAELLGNAVRHAHPLAGGVIELAWRVSRSESGQVVEVRVTDGGAPQGPAARAAGPDAVDGRGLAIVAALALRWGVDRVPRGNCVWAQVGTEGSPAV